MIRAPKRAPRIANKHRNPCSKYKPTYQPKRSILQNSDVKGRILQPSEFRLAIAETVKDELDGVLQFRHHEERVGDLKLDRQIDALGHLAVILWLTNDVALFLDERERMEMQPKGAGGRGFDIEYKGLYIDVKTSAMRVNSNPLNYKLLVSHHEWHDYVTHIQCFVKPSAANVSLSPNVYIVGWASGQMIGKAPFDPTRDGEYHIIRCRFLNKMIDLPLT